MSMPGCFEAQRDGALADATAVGSAIRAHHPALEPLLDSGGEAVPPALAERIRGAALELGFVRIGFTPADGFERGARALQEWVEHGYHGEMAYLAQAADRSDPRQLFAGAKTLIVVALPYSAFETGCERNRRSLPLAGVARYAQGADYHAVLKRKLRELADACATIAGHTVLARACVDTAPLLEREAAARAGVGFAAKSTMTIVPGVGTQVVLGELLVDLAIAPDSPIESRCGQCSLCLDACPTRAFVSPYVLDARRCISYLTIELRGTIPREFRSLMGNHVFGCDVCQTVCPFNASPRPKPVSPELEAKPERAGLSLVALLELTSGGYRRLVKNSALRRASRTQLARNAAVALGNSGDPRVIPELVRALESDPRPLVRSHVAWALGQLGGGDAERALEHAAHDADPDLAEEARLGLEHLRSAAHAAPR
jgi:epoxyqueuosine reductase